MSVDLNSIISFHNKKYTMDELNRAFNIGTIQETIDTAQVLVNQNKAQLVNPMREPQQLDLTSKKIEYVYMNNEGYVTELQLFDYYLLDAQRTKLIAAKMGFRNLSINQECSFNAPLAFETGFYVEQNAIHGFTYHSKNESGEYIYWKEKCAFEIYPSYRSSYVYGKMIVSEREYKNKLLGLSDVLADFDNSSAKRSLQNFKKGGKDSLNQIYKNCITYTIPNSHRI